MKKSAIIMIVRFDVIYDQEQHFVQALSKLTEMTQSERGCLSFEAAQCATNPNEFILYEEWANQEALDRHERTLHLQEFVSQHPILLSRLPEVTIYTKLLSNK
ncbi:TPA: putative quinol monooxygenase [Bacillus cereus]